MTHTLFTNKAIFKQKKHTEGNDKILVITRSQDSMVNVQSGSLYYYNYRYNGKAFCMLFSHQQGYIDAAEMKKLFPKAEDTWT